MQVLWSKFSKRVHKFDEGRSDERCNLDAIRDDDRVVEEVADVVRWAGESRVALCKRCFREERGLGLKV